MYLINQGQPSEEFVQAWKVAIKHIDNLGEGKIFWLRNHLLPPMAEHLSFSIGNQLFFIFIDAAEIKFKADKKKLFLSKAHEAGAIPCVLKMSQTINGYQVDLPKWGLRNAKTKEIINPFDLVTNELIKMTDWELHDFAIQAVRQQLEEDGKNITSWQTEPSIDPSIWFEDSGHIKFVIVRASKSPLNKSTIPENLKEIAAGCIQMAEGGYYETVSFSGCNDTGSDNASNKINKDKHLPVYRGQPAMVEFSGLKEIEFPKNHMTLN